MEGRTSLELRVGSATQDVLGGQVVLPWVAFLALGIEAGDLVEIVFEGTAWARAFPPRAEDREDTAGLCLEAGHRERLGLALGGPVRVRVAGVSDALRIVVEPMAGSESPSTAQLLNALVTSDFPTLVGDIVNIPSDRDRRSFTAGLGLVGLELVRVEAQSERTEEIAIRVVETDPPGPVKATSDTVITLVTESAD